MSTPSRKPPARLHKISTPLFTQATSSGVAFLFSRFVTLDLASVGANFPFLYGHVPQCNRMILG